VRVHDVAETAEFLTVQGALRGEIATDPSLHLPEELRRHRTRFARDNR
jgi:hypothetical protein